MPDSEFTNIDNNVQVGYVQIAVDSANFGQEKFYTCAEGDALKFWSPTETGGWKAGEIASSNFRGVFAVNNDFFVGETVADVITGMEEHVVLRYDHDGVAGEPLVKLDDPVSAIAVSDDGSLLAAGAADYVLMIIRINGTEIETHDRKNLDGVPVALNFHPSGQWLAVSTSEGYVEVYSLSDKAADPLVKIKCMSSFNAANVNSKTPRFRPSWHPNGSTLIVPTNKGIKFVSTSDWTIEQTIAKETDFSHLAVSPNSRHLAAVSNEEGTVYMFHLGGYTLLSKTKLPNGTSSHVLDLIFSPKHCEVLILAIEKSPLVMLKGACQLQITDSTTTSAPAPLYAIDDDDESVKALPMDDDMDAEDDDMDIERIKSQYGFDHNSQAASRSTGPQLTSDQIQALEKLKEPLIPVSALSPPTTFVSGSTPASVTKSGQKERFLQWNSFGQIRLIRTEGGDVSTEIEFNDITVHSEIILNEDKYVLGDMNNNLIALASTSELFVYVVGADTESREWRITVPEDEKIKCLTVGKMFVAVYTSERLVRIFSACGIQRMVFSVEGSLVTMNARDSLLAIATSIGSVFAHSSEAFESATKLDVFQVNPLAGSPHILQKLHSMAVAVSPEASLAWLNVSTAGHVITMDSLFVVRTLLPAGVWMPIFQGSTVIKNKSDGFWPVAVLDSGAHLIQPKMRYVVCRGSNYPSVSKNLVPITVPWDVPIVQKDEKTTPEEHKLIVSEAILASQQGTVDRKLLVQHLSALLTLFASAIKTDQGALAAEYAEITHCLEGVNAMARVASKQEKRGINERITKIGENKPESYRSDVKPAPASLYASHETPVIRTNPPPRRRPQPTATSASSLAPSLPTQSFKRRPIVIDSQELYGDTQQDSQMSELSDTSFDISLSYPKSTPTQGSCTNPFKRTAPSDSTKTTASNDFFADLAPGPSVKAPAPTTTSQPAKKPRIQQSKLTFGTENRVPNASQPGKKLTAFDLWLRDNSDSLKVEWDDESDDKKTFDEFAVKKFRLTDKAEKARYREMVESQNAAF
uniref:Mcl1_mid domain-containing protein n=1 Tax=Panagrellus redivivus TaxID=6233 RepID=A0A7E4VRI4_PANRE